MIARVLLALALLLGIVAFQQAGAKRVVIFTHPAPAYTNGPGDVPGVGAAFAWIGLRGYNASYAAGNNPAVDLMDQAGANPITINIKTNGDLDVGAISTWVTAHSVSTIKVSKAYDQTPNNRHFLYSGTLAQAPTLVLNSIGSLPSFVFVDNVDSQFLVTSGTFTQSQPYNMSLVYERDGEVGFGTGYFDASATNAVQIKGGGAGQDNMINATAGIDLLAPCTDGALHAVQVTVNSASSAINVDGAETTGSAGTQTLTADPFRVGTSSVGSRSFSGKSPEFGIWITGSAWDATKRNAMRTNQKNYWGTP